MIMQLSGYLSMRAHAFLALISPLAALALGATPAFTQTGPEHQAGSDKIYISDRNIPIEPGVRRETVLTGLEHPWALAFLPDGSMLITERAGRLRLVRGNVLDPKPIEGVPAVFAQNQGGLMDVSLHPNFAQNRLVYLTYSHGEPQANKTRVARGKLNGHRLDDVQVIFEVSQAKRGSQHFGARIAWLPDQTLLVSIGDGGNPPLQLDGRFIRENAQDPASHLGKVIRIRDDGSIPDDNPLRAQAGARPEIWSLGQRNIQGMVYDPIRNTVWATEHGALGGDELNRMEAGVNYGWPRVSKSREYRDGKPVAERQSAVAGMRDPVLLWEVAVAPSGLVLYDGKAFPHWRGSLFSGSLVSQDVRRIHLSSQGSVVGETALRVGTRVRDVRQGPDGFLYVLTDENSARLLRYRPDSESQSAPVALPAAQ
jgi:glucose/arabinose dehydrogenase